MKTHADQAETTEKSPARAQAFGRRQLFPAGAWGLAAGLGLAVLAGGCKLLPEPRTDPTRHYTLAAAGETHAADLRNTKAVKLGLMTLDLAPYLRKGVLVTRRGETEVIYNDFQRWAEPLEAGLGRLLQNELQASPRLGVVSMPPHPIDLERDYDLVLRVRHAEGVLEDPDTRGSKAGLRFVVLVELHSSGASPQLLAQKVFTAPTNLWDGKSFGGLAKALTEATRLLSVEIVSMLPAETETKPSDTK